MWLAIQNFFSQLDPPDWIALVGVLVAAWSAYIARAAARVSSHAVDIQRELHRQQLETGYYRAVVVDPALAALEDFLDDAAPAVSEGEQHIRGLDPQQPHDQFTKAIGECIAEFNAHYKRLEFRVVVAANAWGDESLRGSLVECLTDLQDGVVEAVGALATPNNPPSPGEALQDKAAALLGAVVAYDRDKWRPDATSPNTALILPELGQE